MARRGTFGRSPRPAQSLTNVIVSIAREMQAARDRNIIEAWKMGGIFEGDKVKDADILAYWQKRFANIDPKDPLYDTYKNALTEFTYSIEESKMTVEHAEGRLSDAAAARFYINWSKKVPKDSEFYRILRRDAAQYMNRVKATGRARQKMSDSERYQISVKRIEDKYIEPARYLVTVINAMLGDGNIAMGMTGKVGGANTADFMALEAYESPDFERVVGFLGRSSSGPAEDVELYTDSTGKPVMLSDFHARMKEFDPDFRWLTRDYASDTIAGTLDGYTKLADNAREKGYGAEVEKYEGLRAEAWELVQTEKSIPVVSRHSVSEQRMWGLINRANAGDTSVTSEQIEATILAHRALAGTLAKDPSIKGNTRLIMSLTAESKGDESALSAAEDWRGLADPGSKDGPGDIAHINQILATHQNSIEQVANGEAYWTTGFIDDAGAFHPKPGGEVVGAASEAQILQLGTSVKLETMTVPGYKGAPMQMLALLEPVRVRAYDAEGNQMKVAPGKDLPVMWVSKNKGVTLYFRKGAHGELLKSATNPFGVAVTTGRDGLELDTSAHFAENPDHPGYAGSRAGVTYMDPAVVAEATNPERFAVDGYDSTLDYASTTIAFNNATPGGPAFVKRLLETQVGRELLDVETRRGIGMTPNEETGGWDGNAPLLERFASQVPYRDALPMEGVPALRERDEVDRVRQLNIAAAVEGSDIPVQWGAWSATPLALDSLSQTELAALGQVTRSKSLVKDMESQRVRAEYEAGPKGGRGGGISVSPLIDLKVPSYTPPASPAAAPGRAKDDVYTPPPVKAQADSSWMSSKGKEVKPATPTSSSSIFGPVRR